MAERFIGLSEVMKRTRLCRSAIFSGQKQGTFPKSVKVGVRSTAWIESEVDMWIDRTIVAARSVERTVGSQRSMAA